MLGRWAGRNAVWMTEDANETNLSAESNKAAPHPWVPSTYGDP